MRQGKNPNSYYSKYNPQNKPLTHKIQELKSWATLLLQLLIFLDWFGSLCGPPMIISTLNLSTRASEQNTKA